MEYVPGIKINRIKQLDQLGVDRQRYQNLTFQIGPHSDIEMLYSITSF